jgi:L-alanine-DL-glutamate epimerase-like enolase superfamily enzyme
MKITDIVTHVLVQPDFDVTAASSAQDDIVVEIHTDEGIVGIGETDVNPWIARACIEAPGTHNMGVSMRELLIGRDPTDIEAIWNDLYTYTAMNGRRGVVVNAIGAIDMALYDLKGKALGVPVYELLGGAKVDSITPYASLQPETDSFETYRDSLVDWARRAVALGFRAIKTEVTLSGPFAHTGLQEPDEKMTEVIAAVRAAIGPEVTLMVDVQYLWPNADAALHTMKEWTEFDLYFVETPLWPDDLDGHRVIAEHQSIPIASGEWLTTRFEFIDLIERGRIDVTQPDIGRVGGLTEAARVCDISESHGLKVVPHLWKTGISIAAAAHLAVSHPVVQFIEFLPSQLCESGLRKDLTTEELLFVDGRIPLPTQPGLGIELNLDALKHYAAAPVSW